MSQDTPNFVLTPTGIQIVGSPTFEQWLEETQFLLDMIVALPIAIGDMLNYGQQHWPDKYAQVIDIFRIRYKEQTIKNYMSISARVPPAVRTEVSMGHYEAVAKLPVPMQAQLLKKAEEEGLTRDELRNEVKKLIGQKPTKTFTCSFKHMWRNGGNVVLESTYFEEGDYYEGAGGSCTIKTIGEE